MSILENWDQFKGFLGERLAASNEKGMAQSALSEMAYRVGDYLANEVDPKNPEEKILADLWKNADEQEQHAIANVMMKYVRNK
ncbi:DUF3243 domain-containing protein [Bacillus sp. RG28]|uniref:DUF3243 domain-containing protein n=1 Tax=Gottfriedia endophytica TaxID=2820819 RepID=A0A940SH29_9BACI|nr:DUF3243 domain-containing protein [Gottfriedia endophytica]MBP0725747.1 DUF3243 domain-containing protein [Gottfriedia endophytica]